MIGLYDITMVKVTDNQDNVYQTPLFFYFVYTISVLVHIVVSFLQHLSNLWTDGRIYGRTRNFFAFLKVSVVNHVCNTGEMDGIAVQILVDCPNFELGAVCLQ